MMPITFKEESRSSFFLDPFAEFEERERRVLIREDPLTGAVSRLFNYRKRPPQQSAAPPESDVIVCAFCKENVEKMTPKFSPELIPEGRIRRGEAVVFPNLFPYDAHNAVVAISHQHIVEITDWSAPVLTDALVASREYIERVARVEGGKLFYSINWNYTPIAGASQEHPHLQIILSSRPTTELKRLLEAGRSYMECNSSNYWEDLIKAERAADERYVGMIGSIPWLVNFSPRGFVPDVTAIFPDNGDFIRCPESSIIDLSEGMVKLLNYYGGRRVKGANFTLYSMTPAEPSFLTHARLVPRLRIPPLNISDVNYFKLMHDEGLTLFLPEAVIVERQGGF
jgi:galactose-1-phosphate uridylyltransferase